MEILIPLIRRYIIIAVISLIYINGYPFDLSEDTVRTSYTFFGLASPFNKSEEARLELVGELVKNENYDAVYTGIPYYRLNKFVKYRTEFLKSYCAALNHLESVDTVDIVQFKFVDYLLDSTNIEYIFSLNYQLSYFDLKAIHDSLITQIYKKSPQLLYDSRWISYSKKFEKNYHSDLALYQELKKNDIQNVLDYLKENNLLGGKELEFNSLKKYLEFRKIIDQRFSSIERTRNKLEGLYYDLIRESSVTHQFKNAIVLTNLISSMKTLENVKGKYSKIKPLAYMLMMDSLDVISNIILIKERNWNLDLDSVKYEKTLFLEEIVEKEAGFENLTSLSKLLGTNLDITTQFQILSLFDFGPFKSYGMYDNVYLIKEESLSPFCDIDNICN